MDILRRHTFLKDIDPEFYDHLVIMADERHFNQGQFLIREGKAADKFFLIHSGKVSIEIPCSHKESIRIQTLGPGDIVGWSWLIPPYKWRFDGRALEPTDVIALEAGSLRKKCNEHPALGYDLLMRLATVVTKRLEATRLQLVDLYASHS